MTRTDVHSPTNLVTEDYEFVGCGDHGASGEPGHSPMSTDYGHQLIAAGWRFGENHSAGMCYHCGAHFRYYAVLMHVPTHTLVRVGETCLDNRFGLATAQFHELRTTARLNRERARREDRIAAFAEAHPVVFEALEREAQAAAGSPYSGARDAFFASLWNQLQRNGELSDRQVSAVERSLVRRAEWAAQRAEEDANAPAPAPVVEGRIEITGKVLSVKTKENAYGIRLVMTVQDDRGFKVWGTVPSSIDARRGDRVSFKAQVERSDSDETFGFYKRPTQATILEEVAA